MSSLLPTRPDLSRRDDPEPRLLTIDDNAADEVFEALASETARTIFQVLHDSPATASTVAEAADTSLQNCRYHLQNLLAADLIEVAGTQYSAKGREMDVYAPTDEPLVMLASSKESAAGIRELIGQFVGAIAGMAVLSLLLHALIEGELAYFDFVGAGGHEAGPQAVHLATTFFLGGLVILLLAFVWSYWTKSRVTIMDWIWRYPVLIGTNLGNSRRAVIIASLASIGLAVVWVGTAAFDINLDVVGPLDSAQWLLLGLLAGAAGQAYANDGLIVSWAMVFLPLLALAFSSIGVGLLGSGLDSIPGVIGYPVLFASIGAAVIGTVGFMAGIGFRAMVNWLMAVTPGGSQ